MGRGLAGGVDKGCGEPRFLGDGGFVALGRAGCSITLKAHLLATQLSFGLWAFSEMS